MKLDAVDPTAFLLHRLNLAGFVRGRFAEAVGERLYLVTVVMPDRQVCRQTFKEPVAGVLDGQKASFAFRAVVTFTRFDSTHQSDFRAVCESDLLMAATDA